MNEHDPQIAHLEIFVERNRIAQEVIDGSNRFDSREAASGNDDRHQRVSCFSAFEIRFLQVLDQAVSEKDGVSQRLHRQRVLFKTRQIAIVRDVADANDEVVIFKLVMMVIDTVGDLDSSVFQSNAVDITLKKLNAFKQLPDGIDDVRHIQIAGRHLMQHGCEEKKIVVIDECDLDLWIPRDGPFHLECGVQTAKATTK